MEQVAKVLQQLADKLGTTVTYLWHVMVKQAFFNGIGNIITYIVIVILGAILYKVHKRCMTPKTGAYTVWEAGAIIPMIIFAVIWIVLFIICIFSISDTVNSFGNPEYWALHEILNKI